MKRLLLLFIPLVFFFGCEDDEANINGCIDNEACNYNPDATEDDNSCEYPEGCETCENGEIIDNDGDNDGICDDEDPCPNDPTNSCDDIEGCTDSNACNYNPQATIDDGSCEYPDGCTDANACNYNPNALCDDGSCEYPEGCETCEDGEIIDNDGDGDGICDDEDCQMVNFFFDCAQAGWSDVAWQFQDPDGNTLASGGCAEGDNMPYSIWECIPQSDYCYNVVMYNWDGGPWPLGFVLEIGPQETPYSLSTTGNNKTNPDTWCWEDF